MKVKAKGAVLVLLQIPVNPPMTESIVLKCETDYGVEALWLALS